MAGPPAVEFPEPAAARSATSSNGTATPAESRNGTPKPVPSPPAPAASMAARFGNSIEAEPNSAGFSEHGDPAATFAGAGAHSGVPAGAVRSAGSSETDGTRTGTPMPAAWTAAALFPQACRALLASYKIRRAATVGGNVCLGLPAGAVLAALVALDGTAVVWQPDGGDRSIPLAHFVTGPGTTVLLPGEVLRSIRIEAAKLCSRTAFRKIALAPLGRSGAVVMGRRDADGRCVITLSAATVRPVVLEFGAVPADGELVATILDLDRGLWFDDPHGTPAWRRHVSTVLAGEVLAELRGELP
ncbi:FAD binding domain-containing protein [Nocardia sp. alder85J]|nr:FAD binding domain-containing protein [Nocardia sp. alder85J]MCX4098842.1 FAD binding domain-containing protein [Nocardia sp. alder85J]